MNKLPTVKFNGKEVSIINRNQVEDDIAAAEAISRDAARYRWLRENHFRAAIHDFLPNELDQFVDDHL